MMMGERISLARREADMTQETLSDLLGFKDRQILSHIESGKRKVSSDELIKLMGILEKPLDYFTDPTLVVGENILSWRANAEPTEIESFESWALSLVGTNRQLVKQLKEPVSPLRMFLPLQKDSTFEEAAAAGESLVVTWEMGSTPAPHLQQKIEEDLGVMVLPVDAPDAISGGAVNLPEGATIFINRNHPKGRRHFTLAHELFHILTWHSMPPERFDWVPKGSKPPRVEKLADNFAAAVLMPLNALVEKLNEWKKTVSSSEQLSLSQVPPKAWFRDTAVYFEVSVLALKYRLINAKLVLKEALEGQDLDIQEDNEPCAAFGRMLLERMNSGIDRGFLSARKAASLLQTTLDDLAVLLRANDLEPSFSL